MSRFMPEHKRRPHKQPRRGPMRDIYGEPRYGEYKEVNKHIASGAWYCNLCNRVYYQPTDTTRYTPHMHYEEELHGPA